MNALKNYNNSTILDTYIKIMWIFFIIFNLSDSLHITPYIARIASYATLLIGVLLFFAMIFNIKFCTSRSINLEFLVFIIVFALISVINTNYILGIAYLIKFLKFINVILSWYWGKYTKITNQTLNFILESNVFLGCVYIILYFVHPSYLYMYLTLGMSNPNSTGILLFYNIIFIVLCIYTNKKCRLLGIGLCAFLTYLLYLTDSRTALLCLAIFFAYALCSKWIAIKKLYVYICIIIPIAFVLIYIFLYVSGIININYMLFNKPFFSYRETIWLQQWELLKGHLLIGHYPDYNSQMLHNSLFDIMVQYGFVVLIAVILYLSEMLTELIKKANNTTVGRIALFAIMMGLVHGSTESAVLEGGLAVYICTGSLLFFITNYNKG